MVVSKLQKVGPGKQNYFVSCGGVGSSFISPMDD